MLRGELSAIHFDLQCPAVKIYFGPSQRVFMARVGPLKSAQIATIQSTTKVRKCYKFISKYANIQFLQLQMRYAFSGTFLIHLWLICNVLQLKHSNKQVKMELAHAQAPFWSPQILLRFFWSPQNSFGPPSMLAVQLNF